MGASLDRWCRPSSNNGPKEVDEEEAEAVEQEVAKEDVVSRRRSLSVSRDENKPQPPAKSETGAPSCPPCDRRNLRRDFDVRQTAGSLTRKVGGRVADQRGSGSERYRSRRSRAGPQRERREKKAGDGS